MRSTGFAKFVERKKNPHPGNRDNTWEVWSITWIQAPHILHSN